MPEKFHEKKKFKDKKANNILSDSKEDLELWSIHKLDKLQDTFPLCHLPSYLVYPATHPPTKAEQFFEAVLVTDMACIVLWSGPQENSL